MKKAIVRDCFIAVAAILIFQLAPAGASAQTNYDDLEPKTQQYIDNLNEVKEAQNDGKPLPSQPENLDSGVSVWTFVFYGFLSGLAYAFWRWVKRLKNR